ncbi:MAG TPA: DUF3109 family protein [Salinivirgaceae bacterium]|nr:DUF3109 family protein [Salinivirgaceae bacterium]
MNSEPVMFEIKNTLVSLDIVEKHFECNLNLCKGACCVEGESGAPVTETEKDILAEVYPLVSEFMTPEGIDAVESQGWYVYDVDGDCVTPLVGGKQCAYSFTDENNIVLCAIEAAFRQKKIDFQKPISCHLFPIRVKKYNSYQAVNYEQIKICQTACQVGKINQLPLYQFLKEPLIRAYGEEWFQELEIVATEWNKTKGND